MVVEPQSVHSSSRYVGVIEAIHETPLSMQTTGRVLNLDCRDGGLVRKGQILVRVDSTRAVNSLRAAEASLKHAEDGYQRAKQVHAKGGVTDQQLVEIESQLTQARSMYALAKQQVEECTLRAPHDGVISNLTLSVGQNVLPGVRLLSLLDVSALLVRFSVPESEIGAISVGDNGIMECPAVNVIRTITIAEKSINANQITHSYDVKASITGNCSQLMPGMVAKVKSNLNATDDNQLLTIPSHCVLLMPEGPTVWVVEQGIAHRRSIVVDGYCADGVCVRQGLNVGDTLIIEGYQKLYNDCPVIQ